MRKRIIRIFISSVFREFEAERDLLAEQVFPELERLCREHAFSFQTIDLRWGVSEQDALDNQTVDICFEEIRRCQYLSPRPNFIIMAGSRYGWRPLPGYIEEEEWKLLTAGLDDGRRTLLEEWYRQDENDMFRRYKLQPREGIWKDPGLWAEKEKELTQCLFPLAKEKLKSEEQLLKYGRSATEQEIYHGFFCVPQAKEHTFLMIKEPLWGELNVFRESQTEMDTASADDLRRRLLDYADQDPGKNGHRSSSGEADEITSGDGWRRNSAGMYESKSGHGLRKTSAGADESVSANGLRRSKAEAADAAMPPQLCVYHENETTYVEAIRRFLTAIIKKEIAKAGDIRQGEKADIYAARREMLAEIGDQYVNVREQLDRDFEKFCENNGGKVVLVPGRSGSGKSYFLKHWVWEHRDRSAGFFSVDDPFSDGVLEALRYCVDCLREAGHVDGKNAGRRKKASAQAESRETESTGACGVPAASEMELPSYADSEAWILKLLGSIRADAAKPAVIVLDGLEDFADWNLLPFNLFQLKLPKHVVVAVSCAVERQASVAGIPADTPAFPIRQMKRSSSREMIRRLLAKKNRTLQEWQYDTLKNFMPEQCSPLYISILAEFCEGWEAYRNPPGKGEGRRNAEWVQPYVLRSQKDIVRAWLENLGKSGYTVLFSHTLIYLSLARDGLTEQEILDLLSHDPEVVADIRREMERNNANWNFTRVPPVLWAKVYNCIRGNLREQLQNENLLMKFRHRSFAEQIAEDHDEERHSLAVKMRDYFSGLPWDVVPGDGNEGKEENGFRTENLSGTMEDGGQKNGHPAGMAEREKRRTENPARTTAENGQEDDESVELAKRAKRNIGNRIGTMADNGQENKNPGEKTGDSGAGRILYNIRKIRELYHLNKFLGDVGAMRKLFGDPRYIDGCIRLGMYRELVTQLTDFLEIPGAATKYLRDLLQLLWSREMLFEAFPDSYLPVARAQGMAGDAGLRHVGKNCFLGLEAEKTDGTGEQRDTRKTSPGTQIFPMKVAGNEFAVSTSRILAVTSGSVLRLYDMRTRMPLETNIQTGIDCASPYWDGNDLVLRGEFVRVRYRFAGRRLTEISREDCPDWTHLTVGDRQFQEAGGWGEEALYFNSAKIYEGKLHYVDGNCMREEPFPIREQGELELKNRGSLLAIIHDGSFVQICDVKRKLVLSEYRYLMIERAIFAQSGKEVLLILTNGMVALVPVVNEAKGRPLRLPQQLTRGQMLTNRVFGESPAFTFSEISLPKKGDYPYQSGSKNAQRKPLFAAFSEAAGWTAAYYRYNGENIVKIWISGEKELAYLTDPIYQKDAETSPFFASKDGSRLVLISQGRYHVFDVRKKTWKKVRKFEEEETGGLPGTLQSEYIARIEPWLPQNREATEPITKAPLNWKHPGEMLLTLFINALSVPFSALIGYRRKGYLNQHKKVEMELARLAALKPVESGGLYWLVDREYGLVQVFDRQGSCLCREQTGEKILACEVRGNRLTLLVDGTFEVRRLRLRRVEA